MSHYKISNTISGHVFGVYAGEGEAQALDALARQAGYASHRDAMERGGHGFGDGIKTEIAFPVYDIARSDYVRGCEPIDYATSEAEALALLATHFAGAYHPTPQKVELSDRDEGRGHLWAYWPLYDYEDDYEVEPLPLHKCDNCGNVFAEDQLETILHPQDRMDAGGVVPSGECPECGSLCYPVEGGSVNELRAERDELLAVLKAILGDLGDGFGQPSKAGFAAQAAGRALIAKIEGRA